MKLKLRYVALMILVLAIFLNLPKKVPGGIVLPVLPVPGGTVATEAAFFFVSSASDKATTIKKTPNQNVTESNNTFDAILDTLPKNSDAQKYSAEETHQMPQELLARFETLIKVNRAIRNNPQLENAGLKFYEQCADREDLMNAVRARCLTHLRQLSAKRGESIDMSRYSARLIRLSEFIN